MRAIDPRCAVSVYGAVRASAFVHRGGESM